MIDPILEVEGLSISIRLRKRWHRAVDGISFQIQRGEILALVGESGCGKSITALSILKLLPRQFLQIDEGRIQLSGRDLLKLTQREMRKLRGKEIAMIFQEPMTSLNPVFTVGDQIREIIQIHSLARSKAAKDMAIEAMHHVGISAPLERFDHYPHQMSGGMRQRIMIAMALACQPSVLIADEPTTALDVTIQAQILELIVRLTNEHKMGVILITHDLGVVFEVAQHVAVMYAGVIMELAEVNSLFKNPLHPYTQALYRSLPKTEVLRLQTIPGRVPPLDAVPPYCRFYDRCPLAHAQCKVGEPQLREVEPGHFVRCIKV